MTKLEQRYRMFERDCPGYSPYLCLARAVEGQSAPRYIIDKWFRKFVPKSDYLESEYLDILTHLVTLSSLPPSEKKPLENQGLSEADSIEANE